MSVSPTSTAGSWQFRVTVGYYLNFIVLGMLTAAIAPAIPTLAERTTSDLDQLSSAIAMSAFGYMVGAFIGGRLYDRLPGHRVLASSLFGVAFLFAILPVISVVWLLGAVLFFVGIMEGAMDTGGNGMLAWVHGSDVAPYMNGLHFFFGIGAFLSPILIVQVANYFAIGLGAFWLFSLLSVAVGAYLFTLPSPKTPVHASLAAGDGANPLWVSVFVVFFFLYVGAEVAYGNWIYTYALETGLALAIDAGYLTSAFWGSFTVGRLFGIPMAAYFKPQNIILVDFVGCLISLGLILLWPRSVTVLWIGTLGLGLSMASIFPAAMSFAEQRLRLTGKITGWFLVGTGAGGMFLPWLSGQLFDTQGFAILLWVILFDLFLNLILLLIMRAKRP